ncbi:MAG: cyclic nucleotide-binding domain-containing protein [Anaerolineae bacterium]|nr:cyclic nucleotide-binding domain-containing protein [Anaerolineae bacterium]
MVPTSTLAQTSLFADLSDAQLEKFAALAAEVAYAEGDTIFEEGAEACCLYILLDGKVNIHTQLTSRPEKISIAIINQPGRVIGWSGFLAEARYTGSATCQEASCLLEFDGPAFMQVLNDDPALGFIVMRRITDVISNRLRNLQRFVLKTL